MGGGSPCWWGRRNWLGPWLQTLKYTRPRWKRRSSIFKMPRRRQTSKLNDSKVERATDKQLVGQRQAWYRGGVQRLVVAKSCDVWPYCLESPSSIVAAWIAAGSTVKCKYSIIDFNVESVKFDGISTPVESISSLSTSPSPS